MIAVWYHCKICGSGIPDPPAAMNIVAEQMMALWESGLEDAADEIHIGINGGENTSAIIRSLAPKKARITFHGHDAKSELPTFSLLRAWLPEHPNWHVMYHHSKGVTNPADEFKHHHRRVMQKAVVENWRQCVEDLDRGFDAVGVNWVDPDLRPDLGKKFGNIKFFAGNFWWSKSSYLAILPSLPSHANNERDRLLAEWWMGMAPRMPVVLDYERPMLSERWIQRGIVKR